MGRPEGAFDFRLKLVLGHVRLLTGAYKFGSYGAFPELSSKGSSASRALSRLRSPSSSPSKFSAEAGWYPIGREDEELPDPLMSGRSPFILFDYSQRIPPWRMARGVILSMAMICQARRRLTRSAANLRLKVKATNFFDARPTILDHRGRLFRYPVFLAFQPARNMDLSNCSDSLLEDPSLQKLPEELLEILRNGSNEQYLDTLSSLALRPAHTTTIFFAYEPLAPELCSRWLPKPETDDLSALAALASILPSAPYLSPYVRALLSRQRGVLGLLASLRVMTLYELPLETLHKLLLALFRLLEFDNESFAPDVSPAQLQVLFRHDNPSIRYLAIRIMCLYLHASDAALVSMIGSYIGGGEIPGPWEDQTIDFTFFSLWEKKRLNDIDRISQGCRNARFCNEAKHQDLQSRRIIEIQDLSVTVACIGGTLVPRLHGKDVGLSSIVMTETTGKNMRSLAEGINTSKPLLVTGSSGVGKTSMIRDVARELGKGSSMVTLYLNEQTDAKLLVGMYTSAKASDSFKWRPGVLTTAVLEGRWVLIEDLDRAPKEIVSTLLPLLERGELLVPNWGQSVRAAPGFKLIATVRSATNVHGEESMPIMGTIGLRHWLQVSLDTPPDEQLAEIIIHRFPLVRAFLPQFMNVYHTLRYPDSAKILDRAVNINFTRPVGPQDLLKWCGRVHSVLSIAGKTTGAEPVSDAIGDCIFLEAIDCFIGAYPPGSQKTICAESIAQGLHMPAERATYCLEARKPEFSASDSLIRVGRAVLMKSKKSRGSMSSQSFGNSPFATTTYVTRLLESVAAAVNRAEPCLLVGETGTGKTTIVQRLANAMEHKLTVVNLSQQSESGDLLGGYKPVNLRALAVPMKEEFDELLGLTFNSTKNRPFIDALGKLVSKGRWAKVLLLWQDALRMIDDRFKPLRTDTNDVTEEPQSKKRRLQSPKFKKLMSRWDKFSSDVQIFQNHLSSGPRGFAFSFVEGNVVKAARNGEWVLLDEINLASPDTLESLADLFSPAIDGGASILLTESGDTQRIYAHENFRIFGAMNPATDIGKRDLPTSLRSRFTEIFIAAPDQDLENLVSIVRVYLGNHQHLDVRAATDIAHLYLNIQELVRENRLVDGANQKPHFSLRTLTRTLVYVLDIAPMYGLRRAIFEGFSMSFVTVLDKQSELCLRPLIEKHIMSAQKNSKAFLNQTPRLPKDGKNYVQFKQYWVAQGARPIERQLHYIITPFIERNLLSLVRATSTRRFPVLLQGPTSSGKTSMIEYLARISGNKFVRINNHEHTDLQEYLGTYVSGSDGRLQYQEGVLVHALREGYWVVLDELNLAPTDVLEALNRLLDDNRELLIPETQQVVKPHENFMLFATQNPPGMYGGRKVLSRAFRNRFLELHFDDIPEDELETILRERSQIAPSFCTKIVTVYKRLSILRQSERLFEQKNSFATLRDLFRWALRNADDRGQLAINGFLLLAERVRNQEERLALKSIIEDVMKVKVEEVKLYNVAKLENTLGAQIHSSHSIVWTKSMLRLWVLVTEALKNKEPVLLVGETGSGKTTICQFIAEMTGTKLHIVNAHQNMETSDLIGAQRPTRNKAYTESQLSQYLITALKLCDSYAGDNVHDLPELLRIYENLGQKVQASLPEQCRLAIEDSRIRLNSMFEWADGSLVTAMRKGDHFLLDEISLADDSVLERLNSILEPGRTLFLAEKGTDDDPLTAAPGFQFLATMNPGGDYGKRELSPALRNRFTEIWVPSVTSEEEMLQVLQAKLAPQFLAYSKPMVAFAAWYSSSYNIAAPYISIRDLLSWAQFTNDFQHPDSNLRLLHGAAMVYIDGLGANPASKTSISDTAASKERQACISKLDDLFGQDLSSLYNKSCDLWSDNEALNVGPFSLAKVPGSREDHIYSFQAPTTMSNALKIVRALQLKKPILIEGSPGVGKTTLVAALAHAIGMPLTRINLSDQTDLMDLFGSDVPVERSKIGLFHWRDAPFLRAMRKGEWVLLDEMNLASQSVLEGLNACLDHRGQVYIPELDQLFERHPNFVVFAAQNPHHQGGGRKGLPTSFVNRFTVVYAESFNLEDLMLISNEMFPTVPHDDREKIVRSISVMSQMLRDNRRLEAHGGPWEVNLRDALRWLHLLTAQKGLMPFARPAHYEQLLLLQRFRTSEDVAAVSKVLQREFPQDQPRSYFHGKCTGLLEVGLGLLPRAPTLQPILSSAIIVDKIDLAIAESAMLCVQNNWPCLLVGASGCGKSSLVRQLASAVGADILEISLNSEMDTTDLIGGYEQIDPRRNLVTFIDQLREHARRSMIWELKTEEEFNEEMTALLAQLQSPNVDPAEIMPYIEDVSEAEGQRRSDFATFLARGKYLLSQDKVDNRARFEWVNGILVKGLTQGKWVILDNANLCNPSVLDRLNSLLEPDGFLSINEHRNPDGSARVVHPHKDFRLFLTMDPRHGELSRAMRNRSIELFMQSECQSPSSEVLSSCSESTVSSFGLFQAFDWNSLDDSRFKFTLSIFFDHLTSNDIRKCHRWEAQIQKGLVSLSPPKNLIFSLVLRTYRWMFDHDGSTLNGISRMYEMIDGKMSVSLQGFASMQVSWENRRLEACTIMLIISYQTIHPFNSPHLLSSTDQNTPSSNLRWLGSCFEVLLEIYDYIQELSSVDQRLHFEEKSSQWTCLERSMISLRSTRFRTDATQPLATFLQEMGLYLRHDLETKNFDDDQDPEVCALAS